VWNVHYASSVEDLVDDLAAGLGEPTGDPMAGEVVAVPTLGMRHWVRQQLSRRLGATTGGADGIQANISFPLPSTLVAQVIAAGRQAEHSAGYAAGDPWDLRRLVWPVLGVLNDVRSTNHATTGDELSSVAVLPTGATAIGHAWRIAHLLDRYITHRPDLVAAWLDPNAHTAASLPEGLRWQPEVLRRVAARVDAPCPALRITEWLRGVAEGDLEVDLPSRLYLFGASALPGHLARVLAALGHHREVTTYLVAPSPALVADLATNPPPDTRPAGSAGDPVRSWQVLRAGDDTAGRVDHPLVRWGEPNRETAALLAINGVACEPAPAHTTRADAGSLLSRLQSDIAANRTPGGFTVDPNDHSVQVHRCSGAIRQVEALRDAICHLLAGDPDLHLDDIAILTPNPQRFAPLVAAVFNPVSHTRSVNSQAPQLPVSIVERNTERPDSVMGAFRSLIALARGRCTASQVHDLLEAPPVARALGLSPVDLGLAERWIGDTRVRWGLDEAHRAAWLDAPWPANTWASGVDQLLAGVVLGADGPPAVGGAVPVDLPPGEADAAARVAGAVRAVADTVAALAEPREIHDWVVSLRQVARVMVHGPQDEDWQEAALEGVFDALDADAPPPGASPPINLTDVDRLLEEYWPAEARRGSFGTGAITMSSLQNLRSVPHQVTCLLGFDQDDLNPAATDGDDLTTTPSDALLGDRNPRTEVRERLIEAIMATTGTLVITCTGTDPASNEKVAPAVPLEELLDALTATCDLGEGELRCRIVRDHFRHAHDPRYFTAGEPWSFDPVALAGAAATVGASDAGAGGRDEEEAPAASTGSSSPGDPREPDTELRVVRDFVAEPATAYLNHRLGVRLPRPDDVLEDDLSLKLDGLERWRLGTELLDELLASDTRSPGEEVPPGANPIEKTWLTRNVLRGAFPPGVLGNDEVDYLTTQARAIHRLALEENVAGAPRRVPVVMPREAGAPRGSVMGSVAVDSNLHGPLLVRFGAIRHNHELAAWVDLLALTVSEGEADGGTPRAAVLLGRHPDGPSSPSAKKTPRAGGVRLELVGDDATERHGVATRTLDTLLGIVDVGLDEPLPLFPEVVDELAAGNRPAAARTLSKTAHQLHGSNAPNVTQRHRELAFGTFDGDVLLDLVVDGKDGAGWTTWLWDLFIGSCIRSTIGDPT
jgi:exodeoxyribonuclease V gamma subunit